MNLHKLLTARARADDPIKVALIGAGKFGAMYLAQARRTPGIQLLGIADLDPGRARDALASTGWPVERCRASSLDEATRTGSVHLTEDVQRLLEAGHLDVVIEATGDPKAGIAHCRAAIAANVDIVMVNVEADVLAGPLLAREAQRAGVLYSLAWGDQPALICEHVDWARACGFEVVCAGKGTRYHPSFHASTPDTVWPNFGITEAVARRGRMNPKMFNSFIDGTKSGIEMSAVCNATGLTPQSDGLSFPPASCYRLADVCKPVLRGGALSHAGTTEVVSSIQRDRTPVEHHLQMGTYVVVEADHEYVRHCIEEYHMLPDEGFEHLALYRPTHLIGLELGISVASVALRREPTGAPTGFRADVVATAKRALGAGETLDGEGGYCVWGKQMPAARSLEIGALPLGLASDVKLERDIREGEILTWADVTCDDADPAVRFRRAMEAEFDPRDTSVQAAE